MNKIPTREMRDIIKTLRRINNIGDMELKEDGGF
jgi:hypothetical protein